MNRLDRLARFLLPLACPLLMQGCRAKRRSEAAPPPPTNTQGAVQNTPAPTGAVPSSSNALPAPAVKAQDSLVGKWTCTLPGEAGKPIKMTMVFHPNGKEEQTLEGNGEVLHMRATYV